jgi:acyl-[acyl-carrier-protein]-phospholipid O-acyltransferase/long-chain-fatty-acid--[acyl-carrier-protein] ligase
MNHCIEQCGIRHVITSRKAIQKLNITLNAEFIYLEDFKDRVTTLDKLIAAVMTYALPAAVTERILGLRHASPDDLLTVIFTSGSTGEPKGVMLSQQNVGSNVDAIAQIVQLRTDDVLLCSIPLFHSLGYTTTMWTVLMLEPIGAYHFSPLDAHELGKLCRRHQGTIIITAPTFLRSYLRRCDPEDFKTLEVAVAGAEKLPVELCEAFEKKFGVRPVEGYGTTELSPLVSVNIPAGRAPETGEPEDVVAKEGTVGRPIPGVAAKIIDPDTGAELGIDKPGQLWITGPNVMLGYYNRPDMTSRVIRDGWYNTGDIAKIDADGFITITGRESRFSKLGGEMVPHIRVEEAIEAIVGASEEGIKLVVTAVPDERKGERIVVLHTALDKTADEVVKELAVAGLPNLWIPSVDSFCQVESIPVLGSGKLDLKAVKNLALAKFAAPAT